MVEDAAGNRLAEYDESMVSYIGVGTGVSARKGWTFGFDIGWLQSGGPEISFRGGPDIGEPGALTEAERDARLEAISSNFFFGSFLPNIQVGIGYNF